MCTIVLLCRAHARYPRVVAANRDEVYARPAAAPRVLPGTGGAVGGVDLDAGGSWLAVHPRGLFAALTNQPLWQAAGAAVPPGGRALERAPADPSLRSRGQIVQGAIGLGSVDAIRAWLEALDVAAYNPFNLVYGDAATAEVAYGRHGAPRVVVEPVPAGLHVLPNGRLDAPLPKVERVRARAAALLAWAERGEPFDEVVPTLVGLLADHEQPASAPPSDDPLTPELRRALSAVCIHTAFYGTRSATLLALGAAGEVDYRFADGPPCRTDFAPVALGG
ncbi:MAG: NRDE family protein [Myxococcales bacterium]|nr:NRDE family protein [Myxococcales bacterium]